MKSNPVTLEALTVIDTIDRRGSYASAAEELDKATSALSYVVQKLEEQLDVTLFERQGRRSVLTPAGKVLLAEGRLLLEAADRVTARTLEAAHGWETHIRVSVGVEADYDCFFETLTSFINDHPSIEIEVTEHVLGGGWDALEHDKTDLLVMVPGPVPRQKGFRTIRMAPNGMVLVAARHHPLAGIADDTAALTREIPNHRVVVIPDSATNNVRRSAGIAGARSNLVVQNMDQKIAAQLAGAGIGHLPLVRIQDALANGDLVRLQVQADVMPEAVYLAWRTSNKGKGVKMLSTQLQQEFTIKANAELP